jgi:pyridinium-3,5-bisthiocarboxylic acid mononucleotide nickel chelatase
MLEFLKLKVRAVIGVALSIEVAECCVRGVLAKKVVVLLDDSTLDISKPYDWLLHCLEQFLPNSKVPKQTMDAWSELSSVWERVYGKRPIDYPLSFVKILCAFLAVEFLGITTISCSPLPLGDGIGQSPLIARLLIGMPTFLSNDGVVEPAAAVLLRILTDNGRVATCTDAFVASSVGAGAEESGTTCRLMTGEPLIVDTFKGSQREETHWTTSTLTLLEANLDDITSEALAFSIQVLLDKGAVDAWVTPIVMKKGRPAHTISCLCQSSDELVDQLVEVMFRQTTTLGVRIHRSIERAALRRIFLQIQTPYVDEECRGMVAVKVGYLKDEVVSVKPEFDHCKAISVQMGVPLKRISDFATAEAYKQLECTSDAK